MPRVAVLPAEADAASAAASWIAELLSATPDLVLALPAGRTPLSLYAALVVRYRAGEADFSRASTFGLDEFAGLSPSDPRSYHALLRRHLLDHVNVDRARTFTLNGAARDWRREVAAYERTLASVGGLDLAIVGIGRNGHVGFNEPGERLAARTHRVRLRPESRRANAQQFGGRVRDVPGYALSMGIGTILNARGVLLLAFGRHKARIVDRALAGPVTTQVPASLLQLHPNALVVLDGEAAGKK
jgi:glucosamine-6-phosphate deaminase